jgi:hypothetical protein
VNSNLSNRKGHREKEVISIILKMSFVVLVHLWLQITRRSTNAIKPLMAEFVDSAGKRR